LKRDPLPTAIAVPARRVALAPGWRTALPALAAALAIVVVCHLETAAAMVGIWYRSVTFAHGFVVLPIAAWLVLRRRTVLRAIEPRPWPLMLPLIAAAGFMWLVGEFASVNAISQTAFVAMLILTVPAVLGRDVARAILFPLGFLLFAVPVGDFLLPTLMDWTGNFTVWALRVSGVPVYREGLLLVVPNGRWSIIEACSGVRYLIASLMVGSLFAYLNYRAHWRRWMFIGLSAIVPIVANWVRAYLIVLIGYLSNNRLAAGIDHIIYGWVFFGFVMLLMFWIGSRWQEPDDLPEAAAANARRAMHAVGPPPVRRFWIVGAMVGLVTIAWPLADAATQVAAGSKAPTLKIDSIPGWRAVADDGAFAPELESSASLRSAWQREGESAGLSIAYYRAQNKQRRLASSTSALFRDEHSPWVRTVVGERRITLGNSPYVIAETHLRGPGGRVMVVWEWYWINGAVTSSGAVAKARIGWSRLAQHKDDSAAIVLYAFDDNGRNAVDTLQRFAHDAWPAIDAALTRVAGGQ
jgi:exosortase A